MIQQSLVGEWQFRQAGTESWLPASVPGGVHTDLMAVKLIPDPFFSDNEKAVQWVAESDWQYRLSFTCSPDILSMDRVDLIFDGLDTLAEVKLNDQILGRTENAFRRYRFQVKELLKTEENELLVTFSSAVVFAAERHAARPMLGVSQSLVGSPYLRKAPCQFGWDWGPQLPPVGIWKDVSLQGISTARFEDVHLQQKHLNDQVEIIAGLYISRLVQKPLTAILRITDPLKAISETRVQIDGETAMIKTSIDHPQLWQPNGLGEQPLYLVEIDLLDGKELLDRRCARMGLRTLELRRQPDAWGESFTFIVNGTPLFAKGSNWIPADSFPTRITRPWLETLIKAAADCHQNMLRVWGGGFYESDDFYDLCDQYGILIWQDFPFACSIYPLDDDAYLENVHEEVRQNIQRLRSHASLALWCGNNEMEQAWIEKPDWQAPELQELKDAYDRFFHHTLPAWVAEMDPDHSYWPSSPSSETPFIDSNAQNRGDTHYWDVWHGRKPFTAYRGQFPRFMSEFGFQSLPPLATIKSYAEQKDWNLTSYIMEHHQRHQSGNGLILAQMMDTFRMPGDFDSLVYLTLVLQAEGIRYGVEHWRRNRERVAGTLYWQLDDCWPVASWSSLDYYGRWKALHYAARRFYAPLLLSILDQEGHIEVHITNDHQAAWHGKLSWQLVTLDGKVQQSGDQPVEALPAQDQKVAEFDFQLSDAQTRQMIFVCSLLENGKIIATQLATFCPNKHLELGDPKLAAKMTEVDGQVHISVSATNLARFVELSVDNKDVIFSDNYFDLPAGWTKEVNCTLPTGMQAAEFKSRLRLRSLYDSYEHL